MKITSWDIKGYGKFNQYKASAGEGFNIIYENNESGKSTLQAFIYAMLYGQKGGRRAKDGSLPPSRHYKPWVASQYAGVLEYTLRDGTLYRIGRNFDKGTTNIYDGGANNLTLRFPQDKDIGPKFAEEHLGLDEVTFERSAFIRQMQCVVEEDGWKALVEKLSNLNATGSEELSLTRAINALESTLLERVGTGRTTTRPLDKVNIRIAELEQSKQAIIALNERYLDTASALYEKKNLLKTLIKNLEGKMRQKDREKLGRLKALKHELIKLQEETDLIDYGLRACNATLSELKDFEGITEDQISKAMVLIHHEKQAYDTLEFETSRLRDLHGRLETLKESMDTEELFQRKMGLVEEGIKNYSYIKETNTRKSRSQNRIQSTPGKPAWTKPVIFIAGLLTLLLMGAFLAKPSPIFLALVLFIIVISGIILFITHLKKAPNQAHIPSEAQGLNRALINAGFTGMTEYIQYRENQLKLRNQMDNMAQQILETQKYLDTLNCQVEDYHTQLMNLPGVDKLYLEEADKTVVIEALMQGVENLRKTKEDQKVLLARKKGLEDNGEHLLRAGALSQKPIKSLNELRELVSIVPDQGGINNSSTSDDLEPLQLDKEIKDLEHRVNAVQLDITALRTRLEQAPKEGELAGILEELALLQKRKEGLEKVGSSLTLAGQVLSHVALKLQQDYIPALNEEMSLIMGSLTGGRYRNVRTNDEHQIYVEAAETDELIPVSRLSGGTIDQVYFSMRLAAVRLLEKDREPLPIFLDEPFAQYDEDRVKGAFEFLKDMAKERQIFFFTCRQREFELAQAIFGQDMHQIKL